MRVPSSGRDRCPAPPLSPANGPASQTFRGAALPAFADAVALAGWLATQRNDLEGAALRVQPVVATVLAALGATEGCLLARMTGSGATCFGLYASAEAAAQAATRIAAGRSGWRVTATVLGDQTAKAG